MKVKDKKRVLALLEQFDWMFAINMYDRNLMYMDDAKESKDGNDCWADVVIDQSYQKINIRIYPPFWGGTLAEQRKALLHEFCHVLVKPLQSVAVGMLEGKLYSDHNVVNAVEEVTSKFENITDCLLRGKLTFARNAYEDYVKVSKVKKHKKEKGK